jgi:hypothetical protein
MTMQKLPTFALPFGHVLIDVILFSKHQWDT